MKISKIITIICILLANFSFACHNSTINSVSSVLNGDGTRTFTINVSIDVGSSDGYSYGFALLFSNTTSTAPSVNNISSGNISRSGYNDLIPHFGGTIGSENSNSYFASRYSGRTDVLTFEASDAMWAFGSTDYNNNTIVVTMDGCVETITLDADIRSMTTSASPAGACVKTFATGLTCCTTPTATLSGTATICSGASANLSVALTGTGPWSIDYTDGSTTTTVSGIATSPYTLSVSPSITSTFSLVSVTTTCVGTVSGTGTVTVTPSSTPTFTQIANLCENGPAANLPTSSEDAPAITGAWNSVTATTGSSGTTTYTFTPDPGQCANTTTMAITVDPSITPTFTAVPAICSGDALSALPTTSNNSITGSWGPALDNTTTTLYTFIPDAPQCAINATLTITVNPNEDATFTLTPTCDGTTASITGTTGGTFTFTTPPGDAAVIDASTGTVTGGTSGSTYDITYTTSGTCAASTNQSATATISDDATFSLTPTCDGATASISGTTGGTFTFTTPPGDAAVIDASTGTVTGGTSGSTYDITYTTSGTCAASTNQTATATNSDDAMFTLTPTCDGAAASISGTAGGTFSFTTPPVDAAVIDASTGTVTGGTSGSTYDITYATSGTCAASSNLTATATNSDDATFTLTPTCDGATASISGTTGGTFTFTTPPSDAAVIDASTGTVTGGTSGNTYDITYATSGACAASSNLTTTATNADDATFTLTPTCDGATASISGTTGGTFSFTTPPSDAAVIDANTGTVTGGNSGNTYDITYATSGACAASTNLTATATNADDATFTLTPTCDGASASISGTTGGAFSFTTPPSDAAVIDANTGTVTGGTSGNTYDITYTTTGACSASSNLTTTATNSDDATFTLTPTCDGATATISGTTGGTFSFTTPPSDAAVIDANTGTVTGGTSGNTYDITYATSGACAASSNLTTTATNADDATFTLTPTCDGSTASISGTTGGTFSFTTPPSDAAVIDANSGTITGGNSGSTYDITYATTGTCAANTNQTVSSLITPTITSQPQDTPVCAASPTSFSVVASNGINYQWEMRTNSTGTFAPLSDAGVYSNTQTSTLNISNCTGLNGLEFRVIVSDASGNCSITSNNAVLTVNVIETPAISCGTSTLSSVEFNWSALTGATSYSIAYSVNSGASQNGGTVTSPSYTLSSLNPGDVVDITINTTGSTSCYAQSSFTCASQTCTSPTIINQPSLSPSCSGEPEVLSVTASSEATGYRWEISTDGGNSFTPLFNAALYSGVNTSSLSITDNSLLDTYQYRVVISETNNTCPTTSNPVTFVVNPSPTISGTLVACPTLTSQLSATTSPSLSTPWISASTNVATIDNTGLVTAESGGTSLITYTDINGCTETVTMTVPADDTPIISCGTSTTSSVTFDWNVPASVLSFDITYSINGQTPINAGNQNVGTYSLNNLTVDDTVSITINTNGTGCYQQATGVCYSESCTPSQALFLPEPKTITSSNPITTFINSSVNSNTYLWDFGDGNTSSQANPNHEYTINNETENYEVTLIAYNVDGCNDTTRQTVLVKEELIYYVPNTFTPDGDEFNNEFKPIFYSGHDPYSYTMVIFNRWGEIVYETSNLDIGWKGTYGDSGDIVQDGVYIWKINFNEKGIDKNIEITGHVLLIK